MTISFYRSACISGPDLCLINKKVTITLLFARTMRTLVCLVIVFFAAVAALAADAPDAAAAAPVPMDICKYIINGRNVTLSEAKQPTETCINIGHALRYTILTRVYTGISYLAASLVRFGIPNPNATLECTVDLVNQTMPLPLVESTTECSYWQRHVSFLAEEVVIEQLDTLSRALRLSAEPEPEGPRQTAALTPRAPCEFGPYGLTLAHWLKTDCELARALYNKCLSKRVDGDMRDTIFYCFRQAVAQTDDIEEM